VSADLEGARGAFEPLSAGVEDLLAGFGNPLDVPVRVAFCPMAMDNGGARWVQQDEVVDNAYFGAMMRRCGEISAVVDPGRFLDPAVPAAGSVGDPHAGHEH
jgi:Cu(I)/Ag(I) efflux system membrane fusion protein